MAFIVLMGVVAACWTPGESLEYRQLQVLAVRMHLLAQVLEVPGVG